MKLHKHTGNDTWCGPIALSIVTGKPSDCFTPYREQDGTTTYHRMLQALRSLGYRCTYRTGNPNPLKWLELGFSEDRVLNQPVQFTLKLARQYFNVKYGRKNNCLLILTIDKHGVVYNPTTDMIVDNGYMFSEVPEYAGNFNNRFVVQCFIAVKPQKPTLPDRIAVPPLFNPFNDPLQPQGVATKRNIRLKPRYLTMPVLRKLLSAKAIEALGNPGTLVNMVVIDEQVVGRIIKLANKRYMYWSEPAKYDNALHSDLSEKLHLLTADTLPDMKATIKSHTTNLIH